MRRGLLAASLALASMACAADPALVQTQTLERLALYPESAAPATVLSLNDTPIAAEVDAQIAEIPVRVGDVVAAGAVLARLVCRDFELDLGRLRGEWQAIRARRGLVEWQLKQTQKLAAQQALPEESLQERRSQLEALDGDSAAQGAKIEAAERKLGQCQVKAPFAGVVAERLAGLGQFATRGMPLVRLVELSGAEVSAQVPASEAASLRKAEALAFEHDGERFPLKLRTQMPIVHTETRTREMRLEFVGKRADPGTAGRLVWQDHSQHVPAEYLVQRGTKLGVFVEDAGFARFHALPGAQAGRPAAIDLPPQTRLIVGGQFALADGAAVKAEPQQGR